MEELESSGSNGILWKALAYCSAVDSHERMLNKLVDVIVESGEYPKM